MREREVWWLSGDGESSAASLLLVVERFWAWWLVGAGSRRSGKMRAPGGCGATSQTAGQGRLEMIAHSRWPAAVWGSGGAEESKLQR
jgi:hypothetical protein